MPKSWYSIDVKAQAGDNTVSSADIYIFESIGFWGITAKQFVDDVKDLDVSRINLHINSPGGEVFDGLAIFNVLKNHKAEVITHIDGLAASMASIIALAGDEVHMAENGFYMIHNPWGLTLGDSDEVRKYADFLDKITVTLANTYSTKTGKSSEEIQAMMDDETWLTADEALEEGFVDHVTPSMKIAACASFNANRFGKMPDAVAKTFDSSTPSKRKIEAVLRDVGGLSHADAKTVLAKGYEGISQRDAGTADQRDADNLVMEPKNKEDSIMTKDELKAKHPEVYDAIYAEGVASVDVEPKLAEARIEGATAETQRVTDVRAQLVPGHEAIVEAAVADGKSTGADVAMAIVAAEQKVLKGKRDDLSSDADELIAPSAAADIGDDSTLTDDQKLDAAWGKLDDSQKAEYGTLEVFKAYTANKDKAKHHAPKLARGDK